MTERAPISYHHGSMVLRGHAADLRKAGPAAYVALKLTPSIFATVVSDIEKIADLLGMHASRVANREVVSRETGSRS